MTNRRWILLPSLLPLLAFPVSAIAQTGEAERAVYIMRTVFSGFPLGTGGAPEVLVGTLPEGVQRILGDHPGVQAMGGVVYPDYSFNLLESRGDAEVAMESIATDLEARGWSRVAEQEESGFQIGPFRTGAALCRGDTLAISMGAESGLSGENFVHVAVVRSGAFEACPRPRGTLRADSAAFTRPRPPFPVLRPPPDAGVAQVGSGGGSGGRSSWYTSITLLSDHPTEHLFEHYLDQLRTVGWEADEPGQAGQAWVSSLRFTDEEGARWFGALTASAPETGRYRHLSLSVQAVSSGREGAPQ